MLLFSCIAAHLEFFSTQFVFLSQFAAAHIHGPASPTENAGVQYIISEFTKLGGSDEAQGKWTNLTETQIDDMKDGLYYINIHSNDFPDGEIRGQILLTKSVKYYVYL